MSTVEWFLTGWMVGMVTATGMLLISFKRKIGRWLP